MQLIYLALTLLLVMLNLAGMTAALSRLLPQPALARAGGILLVSALLFFVEHFFGLGKLNGIWPLSTMLSVLVLYRSWRRGMLPQLLASELVFLLAVTYGLVWKWFFPDIYPSSERITDLYFIGNYLPGETLPPLDHWFPPQRFDFYYAFQHYAAALMGRIFALPPGLCYNIAFALLTALTVTLAWDFTGRWLEQPWKRGLLLLSFVVGGTGATPFVHLAYQETNQPSAQEWITVVNNRMWASQRFVGSIDQIQNTELGGKLFAADKSSGKEALELPLEDFGYHYYVGDYHPPLGGFMLLLLALACIGALEGRRNSLPIPASAPANRGENHCLWRERLTQSLTALRQRGATSATETAILQGLLVFSVPLTIVTNTWVFPLQALLVMGWMTWRLVTSAALPLLLDKLRALLPGQSTIAQNSPTDSNIQPLSWRAIVIGGGLGFLFIYPFLQAFSGNAVPTPFKLVTSDQHSPLLQFLVLHWPLLLLAAIAAMISEHRRLALMFALVFVTLLSISECIYIDDPTGGRYERTNTVMKWWGWIWSGGLVSLATLLLASRRTWITGTVLAMLLAINLYLVDQVRYWIYSDLAGGGHVLADNVYTRETGVKPMFAYLKNAPDGIVLENNYGGSFTDSGVYAAFAVKPSLQGWTMHLETWHKTIPRVWTMDGQIIQFYKGTLVNSEQWLLSNRVRYIVWNARDAASGAWDTINTSIRNHYAWLEFHADPAQHLGFWVLRDQPLPASPR